LSDKCIMVNWIVNNTTLDNSITFCFGFIYVLGRKIVKDCE
jgi:hypothetical protein